MKICFLCYRGNPFSGGQGVYAHYLSKELQAMGHEVYVLAGPPYPDLVETVPLYKLESLGLYDSLRPLHTHLPRLRNPLRLYEFLAVSMGMFPEPLTFSIRALLKVRELMSDLKFDVVHDNQCLGYGLLPMKSLNVPVIATIHHPITIDKRLAMAQARRPWEKFRLLRWYSFTWMQRLVSTRLDRIVTVSHKSAQDIQSDFKVSKQRLRVVHNGVDANLFQPDPAIAKRPRNLIAVDSGSSFMKGTHHLLEALRLLKGRGNGQVSLTLVGRNGPGSELGAMVRSYGLEDTVVFAGGVDRTRLVELYSAAAAAVVPSIYEGFGFPAVEAMACELPVITTRAGALPEVVGEDGLVGIQVPPADPEALAGAIDRILSNDQQRKSMGRAGRERVERCFSWRRAAEETVRVYQEVI